MHVMNTAKVKANDGIQMTADASDAETDKIGFGEEEIDDEESEPTDEVLELSDEESELTDEVLEPIDEESELEDEESESSEDEELEPSDDEESELEDEELG